MRRKTFLGTCAGDDQVVAGRRGGEREREREREEGGGERPRRWDLLQLILYIIIYVRSYYSVSVMCLLTNNHIYFS